MQNGKGLEGASRLDRVTMTTDFLRTEPTPHPLSYFFPVSERDGDVFISLPQRRQLRGTLGPLPTLRQPLPFPVSTPARAHHRGRPGWARLAPSPVLFSAPLARPARARAHTLTRRGCLNVKLRVRAGARGTAGARAGPGASMMEERAAAAVASAASSCRPLGSGTAPNPTAAAPASSPAPGPGPVGKGGGGGGSPGPTAGPEPLSLPGILHFIQHEWARFEAEKARWEAERAELQVSAAAALPRPPPQSCRARPRLTRRRRCRRHLGAMAAGTAGRGRAGTATGRRRGPRGLGADAGRDGSEDLSRAESAGSREWE